MWYTCVQCGKKFELSEAEKDFYEEKNLSLPKRCKECRKRNRIEKNEAVVPRGKERRKRRKNALRQVPVTTLILLLRLHLFIFRLCGSRKAVRRNKLG